MNNDWKPTEINEGQPTNWEPKRQTNEQVDEGLRDAFRQAKKDGVMDATPYIENWGVNIENWGVKIHQPKTICKCDLFGQGQMVISFYETSSTTLPVPNRWIRFWTRVFFNSKWEFVND
jgi:hypothetical protein